MQRFFLAASLMFILAKAHAQDDRWAVGATIGFNCAKVQVSGASSPTFVSRVQTTPAFGAFFRTAFGSNRFYALELRMGYETSGANRELYYQRAQDEWVRINDRYSTIPISVLAYRILGEQARFHLGAGIKAQYVLHSRVRNRSDFPIGAQGPVFEPEIKKLFPSVSAEVAWRAQLADIALTFCYAVAPLIDSQKVIVTPFSFALTVKKRLTFGQ